MISRLLDWLSEFLAHRKGLLPLIGLILIVVNYILQFFIPIGHWIPASNLFLHLGVVIAIFGFMMAWAL
ncbi:MAG: hypothetical protein Kow002_19630 [Anaerolineales bacterium]